MIINVLGPITYLFSRRNKTNPDSKTIISFTTFPARIKRVYLVVESLLRQSIMPKEIVLYLSSQQFYGYKDLPFRLRRLQGKGLRIEFVKDDFKSHKKYYYAMRHYTNYNIITIDDDIIYPENFVQGLIETHNRHKDAICCNHASKIKIRNGKIAPYLEWKTEDVQPELESFSTLPIGCAGVLYPAGTFELSLLLRSDLFMHLCPGADDLWLKCNEVLCKKRAVRSNQYTNFVFVDLIIHRNERLCDSNVGENKNDYQMNNLINFFPHLVTVMEHEI